MPRTEHGFFALTPSPAPGRAGIPRVALTPAPPRPRVPAGVRGPPLAGTLSPPPAVPLSERPTRAAPPPGPEPPRN